MNTTHAVAGIDPHKHTATVAIVDVLGVLVTSLSVRVTKSGIDALTALLKATEMTIDRIGVEGSGGLGRPVMLALAAAGYDVREVQANRTAQRRKRRRRTKTDIEDAEAIARETLAEADLPPAGKGNAPPPAADQLAAVRDWRESLVLQRVRLLNEAEAVLVSLPLQLREQLPASSRVSASLDRLARLEDIRPDLGAADRVKLDRLAQTRADVASIGARIKELDSQVPALLKTLGCTLTVIHGVGVVTAMTLMTEIGDPHRFATEGRFARWCGVAPVALSSGEGDGPPRQHRLDLGGNRRVNSMLHIVHITQARCHPPAQAYMARRETERKTKRAARRAHKRQLANVIIRHMWNDADRLAQASPSSSTAAA